MLAKPTQLNINLSSDRFAMFNKQRDITVGDGYLGWPECGSFDAMIVTAALDHVPPPLIEQLKVGGRLVMPLGSGHAPQQLTVIEKIAPSETRTRSITFVSFVPFTRSQD